MPVNPHPTKFGIILYPGFQLLDYAGPIDALNILSTTHNLSLYTLAATTDPVPTRIQSPTETAPFSQSILPTHSFADAPPDLHVVLLPGGVGCRGPGSEARMKPVLEYLETLDLGNVWVLTVCTGSMVLAQTGFLHGKRATTNKARFNDVKARFPLVHWVAKARWVVDGHVWTSSGISAGMDLMFAWIAHVFGEEVAQLIADRSEYVRNRDAGNDPFADRWGAIE